MNMAEFCSDYPSLGLCECYFYTLLLSRWWFTYRVTILQCEFLLLPVSLDSSLCQPSSAASASYSSSCLYTVVCQTLSRADPVIINVQHCSFCTYKTLPGSCIISFIIGSGFICRALFVVTIFTKQLYRPPGVDFDGRGRRDHRMRKKNPETTWGRNQIVKGASYVTPNKF